MFVEKEYSGAKGMHILRGAYIYDGNKIEEIRTITQTCDFDK